MNPSSGSPGSGAGGAGYWPLVAIIAIIVATAGWTTVAVMALNGGGGTTAVGPSASTDPEAEATLGDDLGIDPSDEPIEELHEAPALEALLPTMIAGTPVSAQSWTGETLLSDESTWSAAITSFLSSAGKTPADLTAAQALDPSDQTDHSVGVFKVDGVPTTALRDALANAWKADYPDLVTSTVTLGGVEATKGDFGEGAIDSYWVIKDGLLYDVETSDETIATLLMQGVRDGSFDAAAAAAPPSLEPEPSLDLEPSLEPEPS